MKIGILGGGQLGRMMIQNALNYDDEFYVLDPSPEAPCKAICRELVVGDFGDYNSVLRFGRGKDLITIEIEHVNTAALHQLQKEGIKVVPSPTVIEWIQKKTAQKNFYLEHGIPTSEFQIITSKEDLILLPLPFVQKLDVGGYDGKGVQILRTEKDWALLWDEPSVIEALVEVDKELSVLVARNDLGEIKTFPVTEMIADESLNILDFNISPAAISADVQMQIDKIVQRFIQVVGSAGLFAIELFLDKEGRVLVNEIAPRLHNSGHQTQEGNANSQFEQMYRVLKNLPLADTESLGYSGMLNLIGEEGFHGPVVYEGLEEVLKLPQTYPHLYGKTITKPGRKMGHINTLANSRTELLEKLKKIKSLIKVKSLS